MRAVNLLPSDALRARRNAPNPVMLAGVAAAAFSVVVLAAANLVETSRVSSAQKALNQAKLALASTPLPPKTRSTGVVPPAVVLAELQPRLSAVSAALGSRIAWDRILREFSLILPSDIQVDTLTLMQPIEGSTTSQSSTGVTFSGVTYSYDAVARLVSRMALIPDLNNVQLSNTALAKGVVQFSITAAVKGAETAPPATSPAPVPTTTTSGSTS